MPALLLDPAWHPGLASHPPYCEVCSVEAPGPGVEGITQGRESPGTTLQGMQCSGGVVRDLEKHPTSLALREARPPNIQVTEAKFPQAARASTHP